MPSSSRFKCLHESWVFKVEFIWRQVDFWSRCLSYKIDFSFLGTCRLGSTPVGSASSWGLLYKNLWQPQIGNQDWIVESLLCFLHSVCLYWSSVESFLFIASFWICVCHVSFVWKVFKISRLLSLFFLFRSLVVFRPCTARSKLKETTLMKTKYRENLLRDVR